MNLKHIHVLGNCVLLRKGCVYGSFRIMQVVFIECQLQNLQRMPFRF